MSERIDDLMAKAMKQDAAKTKLLIEVAEAVVELMRDKGDEWNSDPYRKANKITDLIEDLEAASKASPSSPDDRQ